MRFTKDHEWVRLEGDVATSVFHVVTGSLRIFRILGDGRRVITGFLHAGDILGMSFKSHYIYTAEAITPVTSSPSTSPSHGSTSACTQDSAWAATGEVQIHAVA